MINLIQPWDNDKNPIISNEEAMQIIQEEIQKRAKETERTTKPKTKTEEKTRESKQKTTQGTQNLEYHLVEASTYGLALEKLQQECSQDSNNAQPTIIINGQTIYRPLTFAENLEARLQDNSLWNKWLESCTAIAYQAGTTKFKIIPLNFDLIDLDPQFKQLYLAIDYNNVNGIIELDSLDPLVKYNQDLTKQEAISHPAWQAVVPQKTLEPYAKIYFSQKNKGMGFYVSQNTTQDQLRALYVGSMDCNSVASGSSSFINYAHFVRVTQSQKKSL